MWRERVKILNSRPETQLFEVCVDQCILWTALPSHSLRSLQVGVSGTLVGGDIAICKEMDDAYPTSIPGIKPGIWHISLVNHSDSTKSVILRWIAPGPLNLDSLPATLPNPILTPLSPLQRFGGYVVEGGIHGLLDRDSLSNLIRIERSNRDYVLEAISDYWRWGRNLAVQIGFVGKPGLALRGWVRVLTTLSVGSSDGPYRIMGRKHQGLIVELSVLPDNP